MNKSIKLRLIVMNVLQWAVWGSYLTSMGSYLASVGLATRIGIFYSMQGIVSIFMPTLMGIVADKFIPAQRLLGFCHGIAGAAMLGAGLYGMTAGTEISFGVLFGLYAVSVAFYMPTIALSNSTAFKILEQNGYDTVKDFPPIRVFGTVGFICAMLFVNFMTNGAGVQYQHSYNQFIVSGVLGIAMLAYCMTLPNCPCKSGRYVCINKSTTVTKEAMITIKEGIRTVSGIRLLRQAITIFDKISTNVVAKPIPNPLNAEVVTPKVGHIPNKSTNVGFSFNIPLVNIFHLFIVFSSYH